MQVIPRVARPVSVAWVLDTLGKLPRKLFCRVHLALSTLGTLGHCAVNERSPDGTTLLRGEYHQTGQLEDALSVRADILGFRPGEIELTVEPRLVIIAGRRQNKDCGTLREIIHLDRCPDLMFRILQLPVEIDPKRATAILRGDILELSMPKAHSHANAPSYMST
jgi:HSP20 family molecular chaperone IbpA